MKSAMAEFERYLRSKLEIHPTDASYPEWTAFLAVHGDKRVRFCLYDSLAARAERYLIGRKALGSEEDIKKFQLLFPGEDYQSWVKWLLSERRQETSLSSILTYIRGKNRYYW